MLRRRFNYICQALRHWRTVPYFGFVQGHTYLDDSQLRAICDSVGQSCPEAVEQFEGRYAALIGDGEAVSFAAARMGFFALMQELGIGEGDEVVLPGATCSVMANAVLRTGARPVYADIDPETYGSDAAAIQRILSLRTKLIVAQHSFGIPCNIEPIVELARSRNIFLLEDCALTLGSGINGKIAGNFGDAALFSTDHSKPLNTLTGGLVYSCDTNLIERLRGKQETAKALPAEKQGALYRRLLLERKYCHPGRYGSFALLELCRRVFSRAGNPFLDEDFGTDSHGIYPYPAKLPGFLAKLGLLEVERWPYVAEERRRLMKSLLDVVDQSGLADMLPSAYRANCDIVPLRLAWHTPDGGKQRLALGCRVDVSWTWFMRPVVETRAPLAEYGYQWGACPVLETIGPQMVNLPCNIDPACFQGLVRSTQLMGNV